MSLSLGDIQFLTSDEGQQVLIEHATADVSDNNTLRLITTLRQSYTLEQSSALITTLRLRQKAHNKFPQFADQMLFTDDSLQQASDVRIRQYRADLIQQRRVLDVCCSIGSDALAFAQAGHDVLGLDKDVVRIAIARHNTGVMGENAKFAIADVRETLPDDYDFIFYDPARRTAEGKRIFDVEQYIPPLSLIHNFNADEIAVKLSPAVNLSQLASYSGQVEFISVNGDLKEAILWSHRPTASPLATLITDEIHHFQANGETVESSLPKQWVFEPDPAILRAGLVQDLASDLDATLLDETIAYLTMDTRSDTPWGRYWRIIDWMPFNLKKLRRYLVQHQVGQVTVKKRGFPMSPEEVIAKLKLKTGHESRILVMTRCQNQPIAIICAET